MSTANPEKDESDPVDGGNFKTFQTLLAECLASGSVDEPDLSGKEFAAWLDERDPLRRLRDEFHYPKSATLPKSGRSYVFRFTPQLVVSGESMADPQMIQDPDEESVYLCGNSLGLMPKAAADMLSVHLDKWARMGVFGHFTEPVPWTHCELPLLDQVAKLVGARSADEVGLMNGLTVNIHLLLTAFYRPTDMRHKILLESKAFPSDHYAVESQIRLRGRRPAESMVCVEPREGEELLQTEDILRIIDEQGDSIAVVFFSSVQYYTGQLFDMATITRAAQAKGCLVGWDCAHSFANVPMRLHDWNVDFACWCTYKYGCSGAGGIAGVFVHERHHERNGDERLLGWWGHRYETRFRMDNRMDLDVGVRGYRLSCTPFSLSATMAGALQVFAKASLTELRQKSILLTGYLEYLVKNRLPPGSVSIMTPSDPFQRGCQLSLKFAFDVQLVYAELIRRGIAVDVRFPNVIRVAPVHLYNSFNDCWRFVDRLNNAIQHLG